LNRENLDPEASGHGPVYAAIERALWALGPALLFFMLLSIPSMRAAHEQAEADLATEIASENLDYCAKWGMPAGSQQHAGCVRDVTDIRARAELRVRDEATNGF
jgi:hypothetical protein